MAKTFDPKNGPRYWIDDTPLKKPFGVETRGLVDEEAGGVIAYVCTEELAQTLLASLNSEI